MRTYRILFLCTGNSARSQMAEALIMAKGGGRFVASSAGSQPAPRVNPFAAEALCRVGIDWTGREPKGIAAVEREEWDFVVTVCDRAKDACPIFPGRPATAHWGMDDPAEVDGSDDEKLEAFIAARQLLSRRIDLLLAIPLEELDELAVEQRMASILEATVAGEDLARVQSLDERTIREAAMAEKTKKSENEWREQLDEQEYHVLREKGTERAFTGKYHAEKADGVYRCRGCGAELFSSDAKFDSGTGWPSFTDPMNKANVRLETDRSHFMTRTEVLCAWCGGHLGHVFPDGPGPTGQRYCINSCSLALEKADEKKK